MSSYFIDKHHALLAAGYIAPLGGALVYIMFTTNIEALFKQQRLPDLQVHCNIHFENTKLTKNLMFALYK